VTPLILPPGLFRLGTRPIWTGTAEVRNTIGRCPFRVNRYRSFTAEPDAKSALTPKPTWRRYPVAACLTAQAPVPATQLLLVRQNEPSFTLVLVQGGGVPKAIKFFFDRPADVPPA